MYHSPIHMIFKDVHIIEVIELTNIQALSMNQWV